MVEDSNKKDLFSELLSLKERQDTLVARTLFLISRLDTNHPYQVSREELGYSFKSMEKEEKSIETSYNLLIPELKKMLIY